MCPNYAWFKFIRRARAFMQSQIKIFKSLRVYCLFSLFVCDITNNESNDTHSTKDICLRFIRCFLGSLFFVLCYVGLPIGERRKINANEMKATIKRKIYQQKLQLNWTQIPMHVLFQIVYFFHSFSKTPREKKMNTYQRTANNCECLCTVWRLETYHR